MSPKGRDGKDDVASYRRKVATEVRYIIPVADPSGNQYWVAVAMRGAPFIPEAETGLISPLLNGTLEFFRRMYGRRHEVRKVGVFRLTSPLGVTVRKCKIWVPNQAAADDLANELCVELEQGIRRWKRAGRG